MKWPPWSAGWLYAQPFMTRAIHGGPFTRLLYACGQCFQLILIVPALEAGTKLVGFPKGTSIALVASAGSISLAISMDSFDDGRYALAHANAHGRQTVLATAFFHFMNQRRHDARAAATERMSYGDGAAVDVKFF